jgi:hypothetical protein
MMDDKRLKRNLYLAEWRANNRDKTCAAQQRYYEKNKEICDARVKESQAKNKDYYSAKSMKWASENKDRYLEIRRSHYARNSASEIARVRIRKGKIKHGDMFMNQAEKAEAQGMYDFCKIFSGFEVDHIVPLNGKNVSGLHVLSNLQVLRIYENRSKGNKFVAN